MLAAAGSKTVAGLERGSGSQVGCGGGSWIWLASGMSGFWGSALLVADGFLRTKIAAHRGSRSLASHACAHSCLRPAAPTTRGPYQARLRATLRDTDNGGLSPTLNRNRNRYIYPNPPNRTEDPVVNRGVRVRFNTQQNL